MKKIFSIVFIIFLGTFLGNVVWDMMKIRPIDWGGDATKAGITTLLMLVAGFVVLRK